MAALRRFKIRMKIMKHGTGIYRENLELTRSELTRSGFESYTTQSSPHDSKLRSATGQQGGTAQLWHDSKQSNASELSRLRVKTWFGIESLNGSTSYDSTPKHLRLKANDTTIKRYDSKPTHLSFHGSKHSASRLTTQLKRLKI